MREEFAHNLEQPDPVPVHYLLEREGQLGHVGAADSDGESALAEKIGGDVDGAAAVGSRRKNVVLPTRSAQSTDIVDV